MNQNKLRAYLDAIMEKDNSEAMDKNAAILRKCFVEAIRNNTMDEMWNMVKGNVDRMELVSNYLEIAENAEKQQVYYYTVLRTIIELSRSVVAEQRFVSEQKEYSAYKHIYEILELLSKNGMMTQGVLAEKVGLKKSAMSNYLTRYSDFGLWKKNRQGKYRIVFITAKGKNVYDYYRKKEILSDKDRWNNILIVLFDIIGDELERPNPDAENIIDRVNQKYQGGTSFWKSELAKQKVKEIIRKRNKGMLLYQQQKKQKEQSKRHLKSFLMGQVIEDRYSSGYGYELEQQYIYEGISE